MPVFCLHLVDLRGIILLGLLQGFKICFIALKLGVILGNHLLGRVSEPVPDHLANLLAILRVNVCGYFDPIGVLDAQI